MAACKTCDGKGIYESIEDGSRCRVEIECLFCNGTGQTAAWREKGKELEALWNAVVHHTQGDLFWIGEILLAEITKETGYKPGLRQ